MMSIMSINSIGGQTIHTSQDFRCSWSQIHHKRAQSRIKMMSLSSKYWYRARASSHLVLPMCLWITTSRSDSFISTGTQSPSTASLDSSDICVMWKKCAKMKSSRSNNHSKLSSKTCIKTSVSKWLRIRTVRSMKMMNRARPQSLRSWRGERRCKWWGNFPMSFSRNKRSRNGEASE